MRLGGYKTRILLIIGMALAVSVGAAFLFREQLQTALFNVTGEETLLPQISGAIQYGLTRLQPPLQTAGDVPANKFLVKLALADSDYELTIFRDGRAIIKGTDEPLIARNLYARYIGL